MKVCFLLYVAILCSEINHAYTKSLYNNREGRYRARFLDDNQRQPLIAVDDLQYSMPLRYQRVYPSMYNSDVIYRPRHRFRLFDERESLHYDPYQKTYLQNDNYEVKRRCPYPYAGMRPIGYARQPLKYVPSKEDPYLSPQFSQNKLEGNDRSYSYSTNREYGEVNEFADEGNTKFSDDKYPTVLANFKIGSKLDKKTMAETSKFKAKRETNKGVTETVVGEDVETDAKVADELRDILDYMGLIDEDNNPGAEKMEESVKMINDPAIVEDENMENDNNKIALVTANLGKERNKREKNCHNSEDSSTADNHIESKDVTERSALADDKLTKNHGEAEKLKKENLAEENDKSLESFKSNSEEEKSEDYEKRVERQIQNKINALKDEVKREIAALKAQEAAQAVHSFSEDSQRKKRHVENTLLDGENINIDPSFHPEDDLKPKIRRRRQLDANDVRIICEHNVENCSICNNNNTITEQLQNNIENSNFTKLNTNKRENHITLQNIANVSVQYSNYSKVANISSFNNNITQSVRQKRDTLFGDNYENSHMTNLNVAPYHRDEEEFDEENDEMEDLKNDDSFYDTVPGVQSNIREPQLNFQQTGLNAEAIRSDYSPIYDMHVMNKRSLSEPNQETSNLYDRYYYMSPRQKRDDYENLIAFHSGGPATNHASNIKTRSMTQSNAESNGFSKYKRSVKTDDTQPQQLTDMSDTEIFGALPQSYDGELSRFKRVKRSNIKN